MPLTPPAGPARPAAPHQKLGIPQTQPRERFAIRGEADDALRAQLCLWCGVAGSPRGRARPCHDLSELAALSSGAT
jgi:hypothetical protein